MRKFIQKNGKSSQNFQAKKIVLNNDYQNNRKSFPEVIKSHPVIIYCGIAIVAFSMGFGAKSAIENSMNQELVTKNSYILNKDIEKEFIALYDYNHLKNENEQYKSKIIVLEEENKHIKDDLENLLEHNEWLERYDQLVKERDGLETQLSNLINFTTGIKGDITTNERKKEELLRKIQTRNEQILALENKLY